MRPLLLTLLLMIVAGAGAATSDQMPVATRYGDVNAVDNGDAVSIRFRGKVVRSIDAPVVSLYRLTPHGQREYVLVDALTPGLHCHHFFVLLELSPDGKTISSDSFGECKELQGVVFHGDVPLIRLCEPYVPGRRAASVQTDFEWRKARIVQKSAPVGATRRCDGK